MLVVFLDFDGVINQGSGRWLKHLVQLLNRITDETGAKIVVHSSWRWSRDLAALRHLLTTFHKGVPVSGEVYDSCDPPDDLPIPKGTPLESRRDRPLAIQTWLDDNPDLVTRYVILDDSKHLGHFVGTPSFIRTEQNVGLTEELAEQAIRHLTGTAG